MQTFHTDVNECEDGGLNHCHENTSCTNTEGSFNCDCNDGYSGSGTECTGSWVWVLTNRHFCRNCISSIISQYVQERMSANTKYFIRARGGSDIKSEWVLASAIYPMQEWNLCFNNRCGKIDRKKNLTRVNIPSVYTPGLPVHWSASSKEAVKKCYLLVSYCTSWQETVSWTKPNFLGLLSD